VAQAYVGDAEAALTSWQESVREQSNAWAWRNLGLLTAERDGQQALDAYGRARDLAPGLASLAEEQLRLMLELGRPEELLATLDRLPGELAARPAVRLLEAQAAVALGDSARAGAVLEAGLVVPQIREGAQLLEDLWYGYRALMLAAAHGWGADEAQERARREPLPAVYDFSMTAPAT
jgi:tetratricopeptide (TPR) repeat protein